MNSSPTTSDTLPEGLNISLISSLNITQDVGGDLDLFVRLSQAGHFERAQLFFGKALEAYHMHFPMLAEYADMLIRRGAFCRAVEKLDSALVGRDVFVEPSVDYAQDERKVLQLLRGVAVLHTQPDHREPVTLAQKCLDTLAHRCLQYDDLTLVHLHTLILSLCIVDFTLPIHEGFAEIRLPLVFPPFIISQASRFTYLICRLIESQQYLAASVILSVYLRHGNLSEKLSPGRLLQTLPASSATGDTLQLMSMYSMLGIFFETQTRAQFRKVLDAAAAEPYGVRPTQPVELTPSSDTSAPFLASSLAQVHFPGSNTAGVLAGPITTKASEVRTNMSDCLGSESAASNVEHEEEASLTAKSKNLSPHGVSCITPPALHKQLEVVLNRAEDYADLELLADVLWRRVATRSVQPSDDLLRIPKLWEEGGQPLECIKLLVYSSGRLEPTESAVRLLQR
ncbi:hypothetical protein LTR17_006114 [Elasticomyces elasticus]|nr:hypothetical protein LTR17_006114 [Elasticomyces elasticus]